MYIEESLKRHFFQGDKIEVELFDLYTDNLFFEICNMIDSFNIKHLKFRVSCTIE